MWLIPALWNTVFNRYWVFDATASAMHGLFLFIKAKAVTNTLSTPESSTIAAAAAAVWRSCVHLVCSCTELLFAYCCDSACSQIHTQWSFITMLKQNTLGFCCCSVAPCPTYTVCFTTVVYSGLKTSSLNTVNRFFFLLNKKKFQKLKNANNKYWLMLYQSSCSG